MSEKRNFRETGDIALVRNIIALLTPTLAQAEAREPERLALLRDLGPDDDPAEIELSEKGWRAWNDRRNSILHAMEAAYHFWELAMQAPISDPLAKQGVMDEDLGIAAHDFQTVWQTLELL